MTRPMTTRLAAALPAFHAWAQWRDARGVAIPASLDFATPQPAACAAP